jgi:hypothetical protein
MTGTVIIKKAKPSYHEMKIADKCTFYEGSNKKLSVRNEVSSVLSDNPDYMIIEFLSSPVSAKRKSTDFMLCPLTPSSPLTSSD